jgi:hypothetical protein
MPRNTSGLRRGGGRPKGVPNKATVEAKEFARSITENPDYRERIRSRALAGKLHPSIESMLWHYGHGKPADKLDVTMPEPVTTVVNKFYGVPKPEGAEGE